MNTRYLSFKLIQMKIKFIKEIINKTKTVNQVADIFSVSRQSVSKRIAKFKIEWDIWLVPKKSWPKKWKVWNKTSLHIQQIIINLALDFPFDWPLPLSSKLFDLHNIYLNQSTIYRILKRNNIRYKDRWDWKRRRKTLYVLDTPWREIQLDTSFPFWRQRAEVQYDAIDDCSRYVVSKLHSELSVRSSMEFVYNLIRYVPFQIKTIRTDQGTEFWPWFSRYLESIWIEHIRNAPYSPQHNWKVERYHRTLWRWLWEFNYDIDVHEYRYRLKLFVDWYNYKKKHCWLWMFNMTPIQKIAYSIIQNSFINTNFNVNLILQFNIWKFLIDFYTYSSQKYFFLFLNRLYEKKFDSIKINLILL